MLKYFHRTVAYILRKNGQEYESQGSYGTEIDFKESRRFGPDIRIGTAVVL